MPKIIKNGVTYSGASIPPPPAKDGTYDLQAYSVGGVVRYRWVRTNPMYIMYSNSINRSVSDVNYTMEVTVNGT